MANEVRFTIKLNVDGQSKVVDATTSVDELTEAIGEVRKAADTVGQSKGWETMMLGVNSAMDVLGKLKDAVDGLAGDFENWETAMAAPLMAIISIGWGLFGVYSCSPSSRIISSCRKA